MFFFVFCLLFFLGFWIFRLFGFFGFLGGFWDFGLLGLRVLGSKALTAVEQCTSLMSDKAR